MTTEHLAHIIQDVAARHPEKPAIWARGKTVNYAEFSERATAIANALRSAGVKRGDRVAVFSHRSDTVYVSILGVLYAGATYVCLNPRYPEDRNHMIISLSGARGLIVDDQMAKTANALIAGNDAVQIVITPESDTDISFDSPHSKGKSDLTDTQTPLPFDGNGSDLAYIMFTSGSTGKPKGVPISHSNVCAYLRNLISFSGEVLPGDKVIQVADVTFDISVHDMFYAWTNGASIISIPENAGLMSTRFVEEHEATHWFAVPSTARLLNEARLLDPGCIPTIRCSFFCGEPLVASVADAWLKAVNGSPVYNLYGPTEATVAISGRKFDPADFEPHEVVSLGEPMGDSRMGTFDPDTNVPCPTDETVGEICLAGPQVMPGYWEDPDLNAKRLFTDASGERWYKTGDLGYYDESKGFVFAGRVDHQVKIRGFRVELSEIEGVIRGAANVDQVAVLPWPLSSDGAPLGCVAFIPGKQDDTTESKVRETCEAKLPDYMNPSKIYFIRDLPLNMNGKVDYKALQTHPLLSQKKKG